MKLTKKEVETILQMEIQWHMEHPDTELNHDQQMGFLNGLRHAQILIRNAERTVRTVSFKPDRHDVSIIDRTDE